LTTLLTGGGARGTVALDDDVDLARDRVLVTRAQGGDRTAFDDLYMRYYRRLYRFCLRRLHDSHEAEDVAQEAFARAWRALPSFGGDRRFYPWLSVIASHLCTDVLRRRNRSTPVAEFHQSNVASTEDGGEELMVAAVDSDLVAKAFTRLSDRHQRILHLREGSGWSYQRIADHEGVGITAVETLLWRARQALKREFASLAGADSRLGAFLGGTLSLAGLRRLFGLPRRGLSKVAATGAKGALVAAGSAVAATAMVIGATLNTPAPATTVSNSDSGSTGVPRGSTASTPATSLPLTIPSGAGAAGGGNGGGTVGGLVGNPGVPLPPTPGLPGGTTTPLSGVPGASQLGNTVQNVGGSLGGVGSSLDNTLGNTLGTAGTTVNNTTGTTAGNTLGTAGTALSSTGLLGTALGTVGSTVNQVSGSLL
jgi:RNA polymerase sigma-70 factor (ECF subfamily)